MSYGISSIAWLLFAALGQAQDARPAYPPMPEAFSSFGAAVCEGYVYVYGGHVGKTHTYSTADVTGKFRRLHLAAPKAWEELPAGPGLQGLALVSHGGKIYRIGGMQPRNKPGEKADNVSTATCAVFDPKVGQWTPLPNLPAGRSSHDATVVGDLLVVVGGWQMNGQGAKSIWHNTALILDLAKKTPQWESIPQPFERRALNAAALDGKVYVVCGMASDNATEKTVDILDLKTKRWTQGPVVPGPGRNGFTPAVCSSGTHLYASPADGKVYRLTRKKDAWEEVGTLGIKRLVHRIVPIANERLLVLGGTSKGGNVAQMETIAPVAPKQISSVAPIGQQEFSPVGLSNGDTPSGGNTWPGFRGRGDCVSSAKDLPMKWSPTENVAWKIDLPGYGQSSPVVWKDTVFVTAVDGANREKGFVLAYDATTGKKRWSHEFAPTQKAKWTFSVSKAAPTPVVDAEAVYAFFEGGDLLAFSHDGKKLWARSLVKDYGEFQGNHGLGSSPAQTEDAIVLLIDHSGPSYLLAVDKKTGKNRWKTDRASRGSWASPVVTMRNGKQEIVVSSNGTVVGYDAVAGKLLWELDGLSGNTIPSASAAGEFVVIGSGVGRMGGDVAQAIKSNCCLKLVQKDGKPSYEIRWTAEKATSSYATPLVYRGHAYFVNQAGVVYCLDVATGKEKYAERIDGPCWASPIGAGELIYFFGKDGRTTILKSGPTYEKLASNALWNDGKANAAGSGFDGTILYGTAIVDGAIFVRTGTALYRIGKR